MNAGGGIRFPADDQERRKWMDPEVILSDLGLKPGLTFVDIGCGAGFFALPAARIVGKTGKVYGLDADARSIAALKEQAAREKLDNLHLTTGRGEETILCEECADFVFFGMDLHDFQDAAKVLENARRMIKPAGRLVNLDWKKVEMRFGPPLEKRFDEQKAKTLIEAAGFSVETISDSGPYHYLITARPKAEEN
ncbi:MAG: methyltransferase domain-containing protein [Dehalococcoidales bacterium]|nr:methyltransferase domain-containing protein [Dehalococcoidales bacterium]